MSTARDQILQTTCDLLENQGFHASGLNEIVRQSGAAKGSIYYYFPGGKEAIIAEAVLFAGRQVAARIQTELANEPEPALAVRRFVEAIAHHVEESGFRAGGPLTIVAAESATTSERINLACREAYQLLQAAFTEKLTQGGWAASEAGPLALSIVAAVEGGIILSRTYHSGDPLRQVAVQIEHWLQMKP